MAPAVGEAFERLHKFMFKQVYTNPVCKSEEGKAEALIKTLFGYYRENPDAMPDFYRMVAAQEGNDRAACDDIAGMSDRYAKNAYMKLFVPRSWEE